MMNMIDIYNEKMNDMWEPAPGIERRSSARKAKRVTARRPIKAPRPRLPFRYQRGREYLMPCDVTDNVTGRFVLNLLR